MVQKSTMINPTTLQVHLRLLTEGDRSRRLPGDASRLRGGDESRLRGGDESRLRGGGGGDSRRRGGDASRRRRGDGTSRRRGEPPSRLRGGGDESRRRGDTEPSRPARRPSAAQQPPRHKKRNTHCQLLQTAGGASERQLQQLGFKTLKIRRMVEQKT